MRDFPPNKPKHGIAMKEKFSALTRNPVKALLLFMGCAACFWTLQCSLLQNHLGLDILETISWGAQGEWGHFKHPPLSGWLGYLFSLLSGHSDWSLYLAAQLCLMIGAWHVYKVARLFLDEYSSVTAALLLFFLFYYNPSETKFSTYFVEIALSPITTYFFFKSLMQKKIYLWVIFGFCCGLGLLNKYTAGLLFIGFLIIFFANAEYRKQIFSWGPWIAIVVFLAVIAPHIRWLFQNDFACFRHVGNRIHEEQPWHIPFLALSSALYPFVVQIVVLTIASIPGIRKRIREKVRRDVLIPALILTLIPNIFFVLLTLCGNGIVMMWFCTVESWTGLASVALFPFRIDEGIFRRIYLMLVILTLCLFVGTTVDLLAKPRLRIHTEPKDLIAHVDAFWKTKSKEPVSVVVGDQWEATFCENYMPGRPPACPLTDPVSIRLHRDLIREKGALLIGSPEKFTDFLREFGHPEIEFTEFRIEFRTRIGKKKSKRLQVAYLPPQGQP